MINVILFFLLIILPFLYQKRFSYFSQIYKQFIFLFFYRRRFSAEEPSESSDGSSLKNYVLSLISLCNFSKKVSADIVSVLSVALSLTDIVPF